jgi:hypothetical protein
MSSFSSASEKKLELEKQVAHRETKNSVDGDMITVDMPVFPEGGVRAWKTVVGVFVPSGSHNEDDHSLVSSHSFLIQFSTFGYFFVSWI